jgi:hypothetical protein
MDELKKRKFFPPPGLEHRPLGCPTRSQSLYRLRLSSSSWDEKAIIIRVTQREHQTPICYHDWGGYLYTMESTSLIIPVTYNGDEDATKAPDIYHFVHEKPCFPTCG